MVHHYVPTIHPFHQHFVNFPTPRRCHACSESGHIAAFGRSRPPCHPHPGVTLLQHQPQRPFFWEAGTLIGGPPPLSSYPRQCFARMHVPTSISSQIALHLDLPIHPCHSSTQGSLAHHWPQRPSFRLVGAPFKCPPPPPISLQHSVHARAHMFRIRPHFHIWMCPSVLASHLGGFFHHKPALVAPFILWLEYLLCAHHLPSTSANIPHCTCTRAPAPSPAALPHWDMPVHPSFPFSNFRAPMWTRFFANLAPSWLVHHLVHPSVHLCTPLHTFVLHLSWACHPYLTFL